MKFRFLNRNSLNKGKRDFKPDSLDDLEMIFITSASQHPLESAMGGQQRVCQVAQMLLLGVDMLLLTGVILYAGTMAPSDLHWPLHITCGLGIFFALAMYCGVYDVRNSYYVLGKMCPVAMLFGLLEAVSWSQWHLVPSQCLLLLGCSLLAMLLMVGSHHWITRPFSRPNIESIYYRFEIRLKRMMDIALSLVALTGLSPLLLTAALVVWRDDPSSPFIFTQTRIGLKGRHFVIYKFRTMKVDAEKEIQYILSRKNLSLYKMKSDPRITPLGRWLRNTSIDELPQLLNILNGDMSIVGPRPFVVKEQEMMPLALQRLRSRMAPGLTCLWQIEGRVHGHRDFETVVTSDATYIDNWNLMRDLMIILKTVPVVLLQKGCY